MAYQFGDTLFGILDGLGKLFGVDIPKSIGESDIYKWLNNIRDNIGNLPASAASTLTKLNRQLESLQMTPIVGRLKTIIMEARRQASQKVNKANSLLAKAEYAENTAKALAEDISNTSIGDLALHGEEREAKKALMDRNTLDAKKYYQQVTNLASDVPDLQTGGN